MYPARRALLEVHVEADGLPSGDLGDFASFVTHETDRHRQFGVLPI